MVKIKLAKNQYLGLANLAPTREALLSARVSVLLTTTLYYLIRNIANCEDN